jgi:hypothetical protein
VHDPLAIGEGHAAGLGIRHESSIGEEKEKIKAAGNYPMKTSTLATIGHEKEGLSSPWRESLGRLVSLWDIMNRLNVFDFSSDICALQACATMYRQLRDLGVGGKKIKPSDISAQTARLEALSVKAKAAGLSDYWGAIEMAKHHIQHDADVTTMAVEFDHVMAGLLSDLRDRVFIEIKGDNRQLADNDALFGDSVDYAFPSAKRDIKEAGNWFAVGCGTAAVFHLMRAAEIALRVLAADRGVQYPDAALSSKQVGDLLSALDGKLKDLRLADAKNWPSKDIKDAQLRFYHSATAEFRDFNEAWRKYMAHAHEGAFYDPLQAMSILNHVRTCMEILSEKISEQSATPLYWISA